MLELSMLSRYITLTFRSNVGEIHMEIALLAAVVAYLAWNGITFFMYKRDKDKAKSGAWRTPEATLIAVAFLMGAFGAFLGMHILRHKTQHIKFKVLVPLAMVVNLVVIVGVMVLAGVF